ncbi:MAG: PAS domain S-box protein [Candidatus Omnitrophota bacterium]
MKLANKIGLYFLATTLLLTGVAEGVFYVFARNSLHTAIGNSLQTSVVSRGRHLETYIDMLKTLIVQRSKSVVLENYLELHSKNDPGQAEALAPAETLLSRTAEASHVFQEVFLLDASGRVVASSGHESIGQDKSADPYFINARREVYVKDVYQSSTGIEAMAVSAPMVSSRTGEFLGVFVVRLSLDDLNAILRERTGLGKTGEIYLVNKDGILITPSLYFPDAVLKLKIDTLNTRKAREHLGKGTVSDDEVLPVYEDYRQNRVLGDHYYVQKMGGSVIAEIDEEEAFAPLGRLRAMLFLILLAALLPASLMAFGVSRLIVAPLDRLRAGMAIVGGGDLSYRVVSDAKDEIGDLARAFETMKENLRKTTVHAGALNEEISERNRLEASLRESEKRFLDVFYTSQDATLIIDGGRFIDCNQAAARMLGYATPGDFLDTHPSELSPALQPDGKKSFEKANEVMAQASAQGNLRFEWVHRKANGEDFSVLVTLTTITLRGRSVLHCVWADLTELKREAEALTRTQAQVAAQAAELEAALQSSRRSESVMSSMLEDNNLIREQVEQAARQTRLILESSGEGILGLDREGRHTFVNGQALKLLGFDEKEMLGVPSHPMWHHSRPGGSPYPDNECRIFKCLATGRAMFGDEVFWRKDGSSFPVEFSAHPLQDEGQTVGAVVTFRDVTERKKMVDVLKDSEARFRDLFEKAAEGIMIMSQQGKILQANKAFADMHGLTVKDVVKGTIFDLNVKRDEALKANEGVFSRIKAGEVVRFEAEHLHVSGRIVYLNVTANLIDSGKEKVVLAFHQDISESKAAEAMMQELKKTLDDSQAQLFQTSKLATLGEMATGLAHEINQPLGGISLVATVLRKSLEKKILTDEKVASGVKDIEECVKRMTKIITHIRAFARQEALKAQPMDVVETIDSAIGLLSAQLREHEVEVEKVIEPALPQILGEPFQIEQVWINAISNARDSMNAKQAEIAAGRMTLEGYRKKLVVTVARDTGTGMLAIAFADNGMGISDAHKKKAFEPFFTTKEVGKGTGLGLSISYGIVESHKGTISLDGKVGEGATLKVYLPIEGNV